LPTSTRVGLWPATFAFGNGLRFHALATPRTGSEEFAGYLDGMQARDYPEGRYELGLQAAAESGDQAELDALFGRASREQVSKLIPLVFAFLVVLSLGVAWLGPNGGEPAATPKTRASHEVPGLPAPELCVTPEELRPAVLQGLNQLADRVHAAPGVSAEETLAHLDDALGTPDPARTPGPLREYGPIQRQLRVLLWKQGVPGFDDVALNTLELVERLRARLDRETKP
jgi:hypothetical protein